jgi:hypothetical protein
LLPPLLLLLARLLLLLAHLLVHWPLSPCPWRYLT